MDRVVNDIIFDFSVKPRLSSERGNAILVAVQDTGTGIPEPHLRRIFDRFYRGDDARDRASGGAGLGLAIVRELVEAMGGTVTAESTVGEGSRFAFTLPIETVPTHRVQNADAGLTRA